MGLSTLERDALGGRLEIHVVLDDADTKLTALFEHAVQPWPRFTREPEIAVALAPGANRRS